MDWIRVSAWIGPIVGGGIGLLGAMIGTYFTVRNTSGPRERRFVIKASILCWIIVLLFVTGMVLIPGWYKLLLIISYLIGLIVGIRKWNEIQFRLQREESAAKSQQETSSD